MSVLTFLWGVGFLSKMQSPWRAECLPEDRGLWREVEPWRFLPPVPGDLCLVSPRVMNQVTPPSSTLEESLQGWAIFFCRGRMADVPTLLTEAGIPIFRFLPCAEIHCRQQDNWLSLCHPVGNGVQKTSAEVLSRLLHFAGSHTPSLAQIQRASCLLWEHAHTPANRGTLRPYSLWLNTLLRYNHHSPAREKSRDIFTIHIRVCILCVF